MGLYILRIGKGQCTLPSLSFENYDPALLGCDSTTCRCTYTGDIRMNATAYMRVYRGKEFETKMDRLITWACIFCVLARVNGQCTLPSLSFENYDPALLGCDSTTCRCTYTGDIRMNATAYMRVYNTDFTVDGILVINNSMVELSYYSPTNFGKISVNPADGGAGSLSLCEVQGGLPVIAPSSYFTLTVTLSSVDGTAPKYPSSAVQVFKTYMCSSAPQSVITSDPNNLGTCTTAHINTDASQVTIMKVSLSFSSGCSVSQGLIIGIVAGAACLVIVVGGIICYTTSKRFRSDYIDKQMEKEKQRSNAQ
eukprot:TRINITY_DN6606_c0_g1_i1.p1 TRINITY_DN6606_c0_g1~~TRINITY_DN6606_c0_g1_i1.p1  ORF type:complete len:309 (-),score=6.44 TRINITY_DN6606_c0_g1_i1:54-980(-)